MSKLTRREFLGHAAMTSGVALAMQSLIACGPVAGGRGKMLRDGKGDGGYGMLRPTPSNNTGETLLALPEGFYYTVFGKAGALMSDGKPTPPAHDGMAAFSDVNNMVRLVRNHEVRFRTAGTALDPSNSYDPTTGGGTTTLIIDPASRLPVTEFLSLSGTHVNCAGGPTPWGSWVTCEETVDGLSRGFTKAHGYAFEVPSAANGPVAPTPLKAMGRFVHEAIAVDPSTGIVYETEDRGPACGFYRFIPNQPGTLAAGGRLQMLAIKGRANYDTRTGQRVGKSLPVTWVDIDDPDPAAAETNPLAVYNQGAAKGGAIFARLEGCWSGDGRIFFNSTSGGDLRLGQVWQCRPRGKSGGKLTLLFESVDPRILHSPDNICVSPRGGLVLCEDGDGTQYLRGLTAKGFIFDFARNAMAGFEDQEFAGATFSPDGETLFVNIQTPGLTLAIWGPWKEGAL